MRVLALIFLVPGTAAVIAWLLNRAPTAIRMALGARPRRVLVSYSDGKSRFAAMQRENCRSAIAMGVDSCFMYTATSLDQEWRARNADKLREPLGAGLWSWKAITIFQALMRVDDGDIVLYMDVDSVVVADVSPLFEIAAREDIVLFSECQWRVGEWATRASLMLTNGEEFRNRYMIVASYSLWKKGPRALQFLAEWLTYLQDLRILNGKGVEGFSTSEFPEFREHRHDMVPLCISGYRWNLSYHRNPAQWGKMVCSSAHNCFAFEALSLSTLSSLPHPKFCSENYSNSEYGNIFYDGIVV
jgi:hypothetical protein